ncbi:polysaccharide deacetylase family protein [Bacillus luteolus]|uniref:Polysaccharide deacetylase family protein n=1 Tax=Litchfieldia luteola TaxID=682179 RepID=A0ABR9QK67_9BACI|nr:polysaccharide deacetylase family protein [Cytobacillus luteolus]MBE4908891.1 polysaccharide deacetylase family protein [Cytobacillus luteolus]MBP1941749.1 peptidoglycan/xylan/chitin deacetylase (PgdA/CDA1 family) [Cytobacillus luteolus]
MKKTLGLVILAIFLTGCGTTNDNPKSMPQDQEHNSTEETKVPPKTEPEKVDEANKDVTEKEDSVEVEHKEGVTKPTHRLNPSNWAIEPISDANEKVVLLTIDDAPDKHALEMASTLKELGVSAIFFVNGHFIDSNEEKEILMKIHEMGFPIGNHTMTHANLKDSSEEEQYKEIVGLSDMIEEIIGERPQFFRAPFGVNTDYSRQLVEQEGMLLMNWTYGYDWEKDYRTKESLADIMVNTPLLRHGANLLMHDREWTNAALADIVTGLQSKGYEIVDPKVIETPKNTGN